MPEDEREWHTGLLPPRPGRFVDVRSDTTIVANPEQLELHIRKLEDSKRVPEWRHAIYGVVAGIVSAAAAGREFISSDEYSTIAGIIFTVVASASGYSGITDLIEALKHRKERNMTAEDVVGAIVESSEGETALQTDTEARPARDVSDSIIPATILIGLLAALVLLFASVVIGAD